MSAASCPELHTESLLHAAYTNIGALPSDWCMYWCASSHYTDDWSLLQDQGMEEIPTNNINQSYSNTTGGRDEYRPEVLFTVEMKNL